MEKNINIKGVWFTVKLTDEETENALQKLVEHNLREMQRCVKIVRTLMLNETLPPDNIVLALFDKQATASFTALQ